MLDPIGELRAVRLCISELCRPMSGKEGAVQSKEAEKPPVSAVPDERLLRPKYVRTAPNIALGRLGMLGARAWVILSHRYGGKTAA